MNYQNFETDDIYNNSSTQYQGNLLSNITEVTLTVTEKNRMNRQISLIKKSSNDYKTKNKLVQFKQNKFVEVNSTKSPDIPSAPFLILNNINKTTNLRVSTVQTVNTRQNEKVTRVSSKKKNIDITKQLRTLQHTLDDIALKNIEDFGTHLGDTSIPADIDSNSGYAVTTLLKENKDVAIPNTGVDYWTTVHSIESKQGKLLYRPRNKDRNCTNTSGPCGHHQLTVQALKDIGCNSKQCRIDRLNYKKSLTLSKKLLKLNEKRLKKNGITKLEDYQKYLIHQQGANGIKNIIAATQGKKTLSKKIKKNMANNSPYSYKQLRRMGSTVAAKKFMTHWKKKWSKEQRLVLASLPNPTDSLIKTSFLPTFSDTDLNFALNIKF